MKAMAQPARTYSKLRRSVWIAVASGVATAVTAFAVFRPSLLSHANRADASQRMTGATEDTVFALTLPNPMQSPAPSPHGMVWISGGEFSMGAMDPPAIDQVGMHAAVDARPVHRVYVDGFWMDQTDVTNQEFARFVGATGYVTVAEGMDWTRWFAERMFVLAPAGAYVGQWLQSFREFPPRQKPGSFNLDRVMEAVTSGHKGSN